MIVRCLKLGLLVSVVLMLALPVAVVSEAPEKKPAQQEIVSPTHMVYLAPFGGYAFANYSKQVEMTIPSTGGTRIDSGDLSNPLIDLINNAEETIDIASYIFRRQSPAYTKIIAATYRGVKIRLILDSLFLDKYMIKNMERYNSPIAAKTLDPEKAEKLTGIPFKTMHEKFGIIDGKHVFNGSSNISIEANLKYAESRFFFLNDPKMVKAFQEEFDRLWAMGKWLYNPEEHKKKDDSAKK